MMIDNGINNASIRRGVAAGALLTVLVGELATAAMAHADDPVTDIIGNAEFVISTGQGEFVAAAADLSQSDY
jgi:hypothetical protein